MIDLERRIRVLIVDDSALIRKLLSAALSKDEQIEVVGTAPDAFIARDKILALHPDVITLDIEMPRMDGVTFLKKLMLYRPLPVIIISSLGHAACQASIEALRAGAVEVLAKPDGPYSLGELAATLAAKIRLAAVTHPRQAAATLCRSGEGVVAFSSAIHRDRRVIALGASTGGPFAIARLLQTMREDSPHVVVVQHMPSIFTKHFAERLDRDCRMIVREAEDGEPLTPGRVFIAPGGMQMSVVYSAGSYHVSIHDGPPVSFSRPSIDVLFSSLATSAGKNALGILLTGMGTDGAQGLLAMRKAGALTIAQNEESCVVFGMPKEAIRIGAAREVLSLEAIGATLMHPTLYES